MHGGIGAWIGGQLSEIWILLPEVGAPGLQADLRGPQRARHSLPTLCGSLSAVAPSAIWILIHSCDLGAQRLTEAILRGWALVRSGIPLPI